MKKIRLIFVGILFIITLTGCYVRNEEATFIDVKFYDSEDNEIQGEFKDYFNRDFDNLTLKLSSNNVIKLNSVAPVVNFYCAEVAEGSTIKVVMKFRVKNNEMKYLTIKCQDDWSKVDFEMDKIEMVDGFTYVTYIVENITKDNNLFEVISWNDDNETHSFTDRGGNTYIRGFYFTVNNATTNNDNDL